MTKDEWQMAPPVAVRATANVNVRSEPGGPDVLALIDEGAVVGLDGLITETVNGVVWAPVTVSGWAARRYFEPSS